MASLRLGHPRLVPAAVAGYQLGGLGRPPRSRGIRMHRRRVVHQRLEDAPALLHPVLARERRRIALHRREQEHLVRGRGLAALGAELHVEGDRLGATCVGAKRLELDPQAGGRVELDHDLVGLRRARPKRGEAHRGGLRNTSRTSVWVTARCLPARMKNGTPDQRQFSTFRRSAANVSVVEPGSTPGDVEVAVVLAADVVGGIGRRDRAEGGHRGVLQHVGLEPRRRVHGHGGDDLHDVVDHHVAQRPDRVVEVPAILHAEALGHGDLHRGDRIAPPHRLEHGVREPQVEDLPHSHLAQEVVDAKELRLVDVLVQLGGQRAGGLEVVAERLLHHHPGVLGEAGVVQLPHHLAEEKRRDLQVEHRLLRGPHRGLDLAVGGRVVEVAADVVEPRCEPLEDVLLDGLAGRCDHLAGVLTQLLGAPVVHGHADDGAIEQLALLQPVERVERHHAGEVAGDAEDDEDVCLSDGSSTPPRSAPARPGPAAAAALG